MLRESKILYNTPVQTERHRRITILVVGFLIGASALTLGIMQYRWIGQANDAENIRLRRGLIISVNQVLSSSRDEVLIVTALLQTDDRERFSYSYNLWQSQTQFGELLDSVHLVSVVDDHTEVLHYDSIGRTFQQIHLNDAPEIVQRVIALQGSGSITTEQTRLLRHGVIAKRNSAGPPSGEPSLLLFAFDLDVLHGPDRHL